MYSISPILLICLFAGMISVKENAKGDNPFPCSACDYVVRGYHNNGEKLNVKPGQILCLDAAMRYEKIVFSNLKGTELEPIIIRNCGGKAIVSSPGGFAVKFETCENFKFLGDGDIDTPYGIKVTTKSGFFIAFEKFTTDFEVARVEVAGESPNGLGENAGFAGMGIKTSPYQDCNLFSDSTRKAWIMRNVNVHHNYIHDTGGEGLYIGHGFYKGRIEAKCSVKTYSHSIEGLRVHDNIVTNTGYDGIQIKNADKDCEIYNNIITNFGTRNENAHNEGLFLGEGVTGRAYNNLIKSGTGHGIQFQGMGNNDIYNNVIINAGQDGFNCSGSSMGVYIPDGFFHIFNNTIYNSTRNGFVFFNNDGGPKLVINNLVVKAGKLSSKGAKLDSAGNIFTQKTCKILFRDTLHNDLRIRSGSRAIDKGVDVRVFNPKLTFDFLRNTRPQGKRFDVGAYEYDEEVQSKQ
jgi:parallel beta-helix repeat protein